MKINLLNNQRAVRLKQPAVKRLLRWLLEKTEKGKPPGKWGEILLVVTDDAGITPLNHEYFGKDAPTDVISFSFDPIPGEAEVISGELHVNVERAVQVTDSGGAASNELALYIAHGVDHLTGASDRTKAQRAAMLRREQSWLREAEKEGLVKGLLDEGDD